MAEPITYTWSEIRDDATERFNGQTPGPQLEQELIDVFTERPLQVVEAIERAAVRLAAGKINSAWPVVRLIVREPQRDATVSVEAEREKRVQNAEHWLLRVGCLYDRWQICEDELFDERGSLHAWADDELLRSRLEGLWAQHRPRGVEVERQELERAAAWKESRERVLAVQRARRDKLDAAQNEGKESDATAGAAAER